MKNKIIPAIKSVFILALAALAVYQVNLLWLDRMTNRNFFLYLAARFPSAVPDGQSAFTRPYRIVSGIGDELFDMRYSGIENSDEWAFGETAIKAVLNSGVFVNTAALSQVYSRPVIIYEYAFSMETEKFSQALGLRSNDVFSDAGIEAFTGIAVQPPITEDDLLRVFFINGWQIWEFSLQVGTRRHPAGDFEITMTPANPERLHFVAHGTGFVPRTSTIGFSYNVVTVVNPFRDSQGLFRISYIKTQVEPFFDNPASIIPSMGAGDVYTFSNRNTMVRYLDNAVIEYTSYRTIGRSAQENFMTDFSAALAFVNNDIDDEIYLRHHESQGRSHIFWFDYVIDNRPLILTEAWHTGVHCDDPLFAPIEVTVEYGRVVRYRRLAYTFATGGIAWKDSSDFIADGFFELAFPIENRHFLNLAVLQEVPNGMGAR